MIRPNVTHNIVEAHKGRLRIRQGENNHARGIIHQDQALKTIPAADLQRKHLLVQDGLGRIVGIIPSVSIRTRLAAKNVFERTRWENMAASALLSCPLTLASADDPPEADLTEEMLCEVISEQGRPMAITVAGELYIRWNRVEPMISEAISDPLTGLMTRTAFDRRLREEWNRASRTRTSVGIMVLDLNSFKGINDEFGHAAGDAILTQVAECLRKSMRSYDVVARLGGDEFAVLCIGCGPQEIAIPMERILKQIEANEFQFGDQLFDIGLSIGGAVRHSGCRDSEPSHLLTIADDCLYEAKRSGRGAYFTELGLHRHAPHVQPGPEDSAPVTTDADGANVE